MDEAQCREDPQLSRAQRLSNEGGEAALSHMTGVDFVVMVLSHGEMQEGHCSKKFYRDLRVAAQEVLCYLGSVVRPLKQSKST